MPIATTCIGAYPKPAYIGITDWLEIETSADERPAGARAFEWGGREAPMVPGDLLDQATREAVADQVACGIDIPTDGEQRRENYIHYHCRHLAGIDFEQRTSKVHRAGAAVADLPTVTDRIVPRGEHFLDLDYKLAQSTTGHPIKITLPGPLTIIDTTADSFYGDKGALAFDLAAALNYEIRALVEAGCRHIQVDEPLFARHVDDALDFGIECLERCFEGLPDDVTRIMHMCCGYPGQLDDTDYPKADPNSYLRLATALDASAIDQVSIEDAHRANDLILLEKFAQTTVILGVVDVARSRIETVDEIAARIDSALKHIDPERLVAAPDCGLVLLSREAAMAKLSNLSSAAAQF